MQHYNQKMLNVTRKLLYCGTLEFM